MCKKNSWEELFSERVFRGIVRDESLELESIGGRRNEEERRTQLRLTRISSGYGGGHETRGTTRQKGPWNVLVIRNTQRGEPR